MDTKGIKQVAKHVGGLISQNSPTILTSLAVGGLVTTAILAVKATPKAIRIIDEQIGYNHDGVMEAPTKKEIIKLTWKLYLPAAGVGVVTIVCIIGANSIHLRRNAALGAVYSLTETAFKEYQAKVTETLGKNKETKVRDEIAKEHVATNPVGSNEVIFTGKGEVLCYDTLSGRYFKSDIEHIRRTENEMNRQLRDEMFISLNEVYYELGLASIKLGDEMGWDMDHGYIEFSYSSQLSEEGQPCLVLDYVVVPKFGYGHS